MNMQWEDKVQFVCRLIIAGMLCYYVVYPMVTGQSTPEAVAHATGVLVAWLALRILGGKGV